MVPSSPYGPCSTGSTTSASPSTCGICPGALAVTALRSAPGPTGVPGSATASTDGSRPAVIVSLAGSSAASTQRPSRVMPTGMTSYLSRSIAASMLPPPRQDTACSGPLPPKMTATRILRCSSTLLLSVPPRADNRVPAPRPLGHRRSDSVAFWLCRPAGEQDHRLADLQAIVHHRDHDLGDRHLHAVAPGQFQHRLRRL